MLCYHGVSFMLCPCISPSMCLSQSELCENGWVDQADFCIKATLDLTCIVLKGNSGICENKGTSLCNSVQNSDSSQMFLFLPLNVDYCKCCQLSSTDSVKLHIPFLCKNTTFSVIGKGYIVLKSPRNEVTLHNLAPHSGLYKTFFIFFITHCRSDVWSCRFHFEMPCTVPCSPDISRNRSWYWYWFSMDVIVTSPEIFYCLVIFTEQSVMDSWTVQCDTR